jgi:hypothetical protein
VHCAGTFPIETERPLTSAAMPFFSYLIVPSGGHVGEALARGSLYIADVESAKRHVQTITPHGLVAEPGLEVILLDLTGAEIWRGPHLGSSNA